MKQGKVEGKSDFVKFSRQCFFVGIVLLIGCFNVIFFSSEILGNIVLFVLGIYVLAVFLEVLARG